MDISDFSFDHNSFKKALLHISYFSKSRTTPSIYVTFYPSIGVSIGTWMRGRIDKREAVYASFLVPFHRKTDADPVTLLVSLVDLEASKDLASVLDNPQYIFDFDPIKRFEVLKYDPSMQSVPREIQQGKYTGDVTISSSGDSVRFDYGNSLLSFPAKHNETFKFRATAQTLSSIFYPMKRAYGFYQRASHTGQIRAEYSRNGIYYLADYLIFDRSGDTKHDL